MRLPRSDPGPIGTKLGVFTRRVIDTTGKPACVPMTAHEIVSMGMVMRGQQFAAAAARGAGVDDLDPNEFGRFRNLCRAAGDDLGELSSRASPHPYRHAGRYRVGGFGPGGIKT